MPLDNTSIDPEEYRKRLAMSLAQSGMETTPIRSWTQGAARLAQALTGGLMMNQSAQAQSDASKQLMGLLPTGQQQATAMPTSVQQVPAPQGNTQLASLNGMPQSDTIAPVLKKMESGGDYNNVTTTKDRNGNEQHALGAYGVMHFNVGPWSQEILGKSLTPEEFLKDPKAQDTIALGKFNQYAEKYGGPEPAFRAWLGGEGNMNKPNAADALGTTVKGYSDKAMGLLAQQQGGGQPVQQQAANLPQGQQPQAQATQGNPDMMRGIQSMLASGNPYAQQYGRQMASTVIGQRLEPPKLTLVPNMMGGSDAYWANAADRTFVPALSGGVGGGLASTLQGGSKEEVLAAMDKQYPGVANRVEQLYRGEGGMPNRRQNPLDGPALSLIQVVHPDWNMADWQSKSGTQVDFAKGKAADAIQSFNRALKHAGDMWDTVDDLHNQSFLPGIQNPVRNLVAGQVSQQYQNASKQFGTLKLGVSTEMDKAMKGMGVPDVEGIRQWNNQFNIDSPPNGIRSAIQASVKNLLKGAMDAAATRWNQGMKVSDPADPRYKRGEDFLSPGALAQYNKIVNADPDQPSRSAGQPSPQPQATQPQGGLPPGWSVRVQ